MKIHLKTLSLLWAVLWLVSCADSGDSADAAADQAEPVIRQIAGNAALGRPASWSSNCAPEACARADQEGNYLLATEIEGSSLMWSDIPLEDGRTRRLYSRYRWSDEVTTSLVNLNPSTHVILDIWSNVSQQQSIDTCAQSDACTDTLLSSLTESQEATIINQLDQLMGDAWPAGRDPFEDIYIADPSIDALDAMHDHIQFVVSSDALMVFDNEGQLLTQVGLSQLTRSLSLADAVLSTTQYRDAQTLEPESPAPNPIVLSVSISPSQPNRVPFTLTVNTARSSSPNGSLSFTHDLTLADGSNRTFQGDSISTSIETGGNHIWVVTAVDEAGRSRVQGYTINALSGEDDTPVFGGEGSCITPEFALTANTLNICEEAQDGGQYQCDTLASSSVTLTLSPAPCSPLSQNNGALIGICTILTNEVRLFYYENPLRPNYTETFTEKQVRFESYCRDNFAGDWAATP